MKVSIRLKRKWLFEKDLGVYDVSVKDTIIPRIGEILDLGTGLFKIVRVYHQFPLKKTTLYVEQYHEEEG